MVSGEKIEEVAQLIKDGFIDYRGQFMTITRRAKSRFERRNWNGIQYDAKERLELYKVAVADLLNKIWKKLGDDTRKRETWKALKPVYLRLVKDRLDHELAETFYNSFTRKIFTTLGVDEEIEFVSPYDEELPELTNSNIYNTYIPKVSTYDMISQILGDYSFFIQYDNVNYYIHLISNKIKERISMDYTSFDFDRVELLKPVFFRNKGAYIIGRIIKNEEVIPFALALINPYDTGIVIDAVLLTSNEVSVIFSFTRSYFLADIENTSALMIFLKSIMPLKRRSELYNSIGCDKHGKTVLYREIIKHLDSTDDKFAIAQGIKGMVMAVYTLPTMNIVFKIIKDRFDPPKSTTRQAVINKYKIVFMHDRVGRLADAQEFEYLVFNKNRFEPDVLEELLTDASQSVEEQGDKIIMKHVYTERKMIPLNIYLNEATKEEAEDAIIEYGNAIKELAAANIFPGDLLIKNFGVTRHGRVVFYDYDELCFVTDCNFRRLPQARTEDDIHSSEPWYSVDENDIFPEELRKFIIAPGPLKQVFMEYHADLFTVEFWLDMQKRQERGEIIDVYPYHKVKRFHKRMV